MIIEALEKVIAGEDLTRAEISGAVQEIESGRATRNQLVALFTALSMKGMSQEEEAGIGEMDRRWASYAAQSRTGSGTAHEFRDPDLGESVAVTTTITGPDVELGARTSLVFQGKDLSRADAEGAMDAILSGRVDERRIAAFVTALRFKGETVDEVVGFATALRKHASPVFTSCRPPDEVIVDTCGTGGDAKGTFNISTAAAFVVAGAGVRVAKHGNRSISSKCGSVDVLEALGVKVDLPPERVIQSIEEVGIGFLFAPAVHAATRHAMPVRRELKIRTVFNLLGPLTNPAGASAQVAGVYDGGVTELMARAMGELGVKRAFVVHGADGLDEISTSGETSIAELRDGSVRSYTVVPEDFGVPRAPLDEIRGGDATHNARILTGMFGRDGHPHEHGPYRDIVLVNSAAALVAAGRAPDFLAGMRIAAESVDSGAARQRLDALIAFTQSETGHGQGAS